MHPLTGKPLPDARLKAVPFDLPAELESLIMKALALNKAHRYESSHAFGDALTGYLYSTTPRFSALSLSHFVRAGFAA